MHTSATGLSGVVGNVTDSVRAKLQLVQLTDTALQTPCATPGMSCHTVCSDAAAFQGIRKPELVHAV